MKISDLLLIGGAVAVGYMLLKPKEAEAEDIIQPSPIVTIEEPVAETPIATPPPTLTENPYDKYIGKIANLTLDGKGIFVYLWEMGNWDEIPGGMSVPPSYQSVAHGFVINNSYLMEDGITMCCLLTEHNTGNSIIAYVNTGTKKITLFEQNYFAWASA